jgi:hypothetical protein
MTLKRIAQIGILVGAFLTGHLTMRVVGGKTDPASSMAGFFMFRAHCAIPAESTPPSRTDNPAANVSYLHLLQTNAPF